MSLTAGITGVCPYTKALFDEYILATKQTELGRNSQYACITMAIQDLGKLNCEVFMSPPSTPLCSCKKAFGISWNINVNRNRGANVLTGGTEPTSY